MGAGAGTHGVRVLAVLPAVCASPERARRRGKSRGGPAPGRPTRGWADGGPADHVRVVERHRPRPPDAVDGDRETTRSRHRVAVRDAVAGRSGGPRDGLPGRVHGVPRQPHRGQRPPLVAAYDGSPPRRDLGGRPGPPRLRRDPAVRPAARHDEAGAGDCLVPARAVAARGEHGSIDPERPLRRDPRARGLRGIGRRRPDQLPPRRGARGPADRVPRRRRAPAARRRGARAGPRAREADDPGAARPGPGGSGRDRALPAHPRPRRRRAGRSRVLGDLRPAGRPRGRRRTCARPIP